MSGYFSNFQKMNYSLEDNPNDNIQLVTNILQRSKFLREIVENSATYYPYQIKDGETAEIIADKLYGDSNRHWIILLFNQILNPMYEFPLVDEVLDTYILNKWGISSDEAKSTLHHYEQQITRSALVDGQPTETNVDVYTVSEYEVNYTTGALSPRSLPSINNSITVSTEQVYLNSPANTISAFQTTKIYAISIYDYESDLNESRREIKLLDEKYVHSVELEFKKIMSNG